MAAGCYLPELGKLMSVKSVGKEIRGVEVTIGESVLQASGLKTWDGARSANSSVAATCTHDRAFLRTGPGQFALRAFRQETMQVSMTRLRSTPRPSAIATCPAAG